MPESVEVKKISDYLWEIPQTGEMRVPGRIYGDRAIINQLTADLSREWSALRQVRNAACLPGIQKFALAMADIHPGYGFPIGGVGAFDMEEGIVTFAGVGYDCNCGVRTMILPLSRAEVEEKKAELADALYRGIPAGLGSHGDFRLTMREIDELLREGARFAISRGYGIETDIEYIEENGCIAGAKPENVSDRAKERQFRQVGSLGSGNHYLEVQYVDEIYDPEAARAYRLELNSVVISIHTGSRALGHQIGTDYLVKLKRASEKYKLPIREQELVGAPIKSPEGQEYLSAVFCGINCAFANRQAIGHLARKCVCQVFGTDADSIRILYDVGHNTAKLERHRVGGREKLLLVHRKGATRAFAAGSPGIPAAYRGVGHPVLVGGTMGTYSFILRGTEKGMEETFGSSVHGAGRLKSRTQALKEFRGERIVGELRTRGIIVRPHSMPGAAEEAPGAYKDVEEVVKVMEGAGVSTRVVRLRPMICVKG
ncbi:MAG: RtcB family protein [Candidatus Aureabacteria bacterium]|nr:RtcB family protein [Candidatus Auribacterota bacterium]